MTLRIFLSSCFECSLGFETTSASRVSVRSTFAHTRRMKNYKFLICGRPQSHGPSSSTARCWPPRPTLPSYKTVLFDNLAHVLSNYFLFSPILYTTSVLIHPLPLLCIVVLAALYVYMFLQHHDVLKVGPVHLTANLKKATLGLGAMRTAHYHQ